MTEDDSESSSSWFSPGFGFDLNPDPFGIGALLTATSPVVQLGTSLRQMTESLDKLFEPERIMLEVVESWATEHRQMFENIAQAATLAIPRFSLFTTPSAKVVKADRQIVEGEIVEPKTLEVTYQPEILVSAFGVGLTPTGRFYDKVQDKDLTPLNTGSTSGKYLMLLISSNYHYVTDDKVDRLMKSSGYHGGQRQLRQDLRKLLKRHGLDIVTRRTTKRGTTLADFTRL
jgi:hypothetical protein